MPGMGTHQPEDLIHTVSYPGLKTNHGLRVILAEDLRSRAGRPRVFCHPLDIAVAAGIYVDDRGPVECGPEVHDVDWIRYQHCADVRELGLRVYHRLAHHILARSVVGWTEEDAWLLTSELVMPTMCGIEIPDADLAMRAQQYATVEMITTAWEACQQSGVRKRNTSGVVRLHW
jgi:hypothetical protein